MMNLLRIALAWLIAIPPVHAFSPNCDKCSDLPELYRELLEQEFLLNHFQSMIDQQYFPRSIDQMKDAAARKLTDAMAGDLYGVLKPSASGGGGGGGPAAAPAYATDWGSRACGLLEIRQITQADGTKQEVSRPVTPAQIRLRHCLPVAEYLITHEAAHQGTCRGIWRGSEAERQQTLQSVAAYAEDDAKAYRAGIAALRKYIAELAARCAWEGSTHKVKPDGTFVVPTPQQIETLQHNKAAKARALKRASR